MTKGAEVAPSSVLGAADSEQSSHITVLLAEAVDALAIKKGGTYIDCTFGRGGHSKRILSQLGPKGRLFAIDRDMAAYATGEAIDDPRFYMEHLHFSELNQLAAKHQLTSVDGILMDLGISSPQVDVGERGFSFRLNGPLDMRMDQTRGKTVAALLETITEKRLGEVIKNYLSHLYQILHLANNFDCYKLNHHTVRFQ